MLTILFYSLITLGLFLSARAGIYYTYYYPAKKVSLPELMRVFGKGMRFDLSIFFSVFGGLIVLAYLPFPFVYSAHYRSVLSVLWFLLFIISVLILVGDFIYFEFTGRHTTYELEMVATESGVLLKTFLKDYPALMILTLVVIGGGGWFWVWISRIPVTEEIFPGYATAIMRFIGLSFLVVFMARGQRLTGKPIATVDAYRGVNVERAPLIMNGLFSSLSYFFKSKNFRLDSTLNNETAIQKVLDVIRPVRTADSSDYPLLQYSSIQDGRGWINKPNIVVFLVEGLNSHCLPGLFRNAPSPWSGEAIMPYLNRLIGESWAFPYFYANGQRSVDCYHTLFTSIPRMGQVPPIGYEHDFSNVRYFYLPQILKRNGYQTCLFKGPWSRAGRMDSVSSLVGMDSYIAGEQINAHYLKGSGLPSSEVGAWDEHLLRCVYDDLSGKTEKYFSVILTGSSHSPFQVPGKKYEVFGKSGRRERYFNSMRYLDGKLEWFFEEIKTDRSFDKTVFIILGDHVIFHPEGRWETTGLFHVPLLIYCPIHIPARFDQRIASQMDLFPTLLKMAENEYPHTNFGRSLIDESIDPFAVMTQGELLHATDGEHWIKVPEIQNPPETYRLSNGYFLEPCGMNGRIEDLLLKSRAYWHTINLLFLKDAFFPNFKDHPLVRNSKDPASLKFK